MAQYSPMCGRFLLTSPVEALRRMFGVESGLNLPARYNIAPTQVTVVLRPADDGTGDGGRELVLLRWGLVPSWAKDLSIGSKLIHARSDGVATKPSFRAAFRQRRCLVPADGFYEWSEAQGPKSKQPYLIQRRDGAPFTLAGLWEQWKSGGETVETFALITTDANATLGAIHHRMPVIIAEADREAWLDPANKDAEALLKPAPDEDLTAIPISTRVNNVRNDDPSLIVPVDPAAAAAEPASAPALPARPAAKARGKAPSSQGSLF